MKRNGSFFQALTAVSLFGLLAGPSFARRSSGVTGADRQFMIKTAQANIGEVKGGQLALTRAVASPARDFAQHMIDDHSRANVELKKLARQKGVRLPSDTDLKHKQMAHMLAARSGDAFDRAYLKAMIDGHRKVIAMFQSEVADGRDPDVKAWASQTLPTLQRHLQHATEALASVHDQTKHGKMGHPR